eukprot:5505299-Prymnesium_polylepis.1
MGYSHDPPLRKHNLEGRTGFFQVCRACALFLNLPELHTRMFSSLLGHSRGGGVRKRRVVRHAEEGAERRDLLGEGHRRQCDGT